MPIHFVLIFESNIFHCTYSFLLFSLNANDWKFRNCWNVGKKYLFFPSSKPNQFEWSFSEAICSRHSGTNLNSKRCTPNCGSSDFPKECGLIVVYEWVLFVHISVRYDSDFHQNNGRRIKFYNGTFLCKS